MSRNRTRYSDVTLENGERDTLCLFYTNVAVASRRDADRIERDLADDAAELGWTGYIVRWNDEPVKIGALL